MTTAESPMWKLRQQARTCARALKKAERGEGFVIDPAGKMDAARRKPDVTFAVVMDDKTLRITMAWRVIRETTEDGLAEFILNCMRDSRATTH